MFDDILGGVFDETIDEIGGIGGLQDDEWDTGDKPTFWSSGQKPDMWTTIDDVWVS